MLRTQPVFSLGWHLRAEACQNAGRGRCRRGPLDCEQCDRLLSGLAIQPFLNGNPPKLEVGHTTLDLFPLLLLMFLDCLPLSLSCLPQHLSLFFSRLLVYLLLSLGRRLGLALIFWDTHALRFGRYRPCKTQGEQQCENDNTSHGEFPFVTSNGSECMSAPGAC